MTDRDPVHTELNSAPSSASSSLACLTARLLIRVVILRHRCAVNLALSEIFDVNDLLDVIVGVAHMVKDVGTQGEGHEEHYP